MKLIINNLEIEILSVKEETTIIDNNLYSILYFKLQNNTLDKKVLESLNNHELDINIEHDETCDLYQKYKFVDIINSQLIFRRQLR